MVNNANHTGWHVDGRPRVLSNDQTDQIIQYVKECDETLAPLTQTALVQWVNTTFGKSLTMGWLQSFILGENGLFIVDAEQIEDARSNITDKQLIANAKILSEKVAIAHPDLIININETALDAKQDTKKI